VVIPSYNHARFVAQAIQSVLDQDYSALELIIVDDGSKDGSLDAIRCAIENVHSRSVRLIAQHNTGANIAIMHGLHQARGEILTILNSDDLYHPARLSTIVENVSAHEDFIAFSKVGFIDDRGEQLAPNSGIANWYDKALREGAECPTVGYGLLRNNFSITSGNLVFTRRLYEYVGGFQHYKMCHDWDFLIRATHYVEPIYIQNVLMDYRVHESNTLHSTQHLELGEGSSVINAFARRGLAETPPNMLCPGWAHWPLYFDHFIDSYSCWLSDRPIRDFLNVTPPQFPVSCLKSWADANKVGVPDYGHLTSTRVPGSALDAFGFARESAFRRTVGGKQPFCSWIS